jgi:hypothetical protein
MCAARHIGVKDLLDFVLGRAIDEKQRQDPDQQDGRDQQDNQTPPDGSVGTHRFGIM